MKPHVAVVVGLCLVFPDDWLYAAGSDRPIHTHTRVLVHVWLVFFASIVVFFFAKVIRC